MANLVFTPAEVNVTMTKGDSLSIEVELQNDNGTAYGLPSGTLVFTSSIKKVSDSTSAGSFTCTQVGTSNKINMYMSPSTSAALVPATQYKYDLQMSEGSDSTGTKKTFIKGTIDVESDVT
jgi:hypothetical protein